MQLDSNYLQHQLKILADDMKDDEPKVAKAYLFIRDRLNQSYPDGDVSREEIEDILRQPQARAHSANLPNWALDHLFESKTTKRKMIKESKYPAINLVKRLIKEQIQLK